MMIIILRRGLDKKDENNLSNEILKLEELNKKEF